MIKILCNIYFKYIEEGEIQEIQLDYGQIISLEFKTTDRADINKPSYGIISNGGNISFKDVFYNGEYIFSKYSEMGYLKNKATIELCLRNTKNGKEQTIGIFESEKFEYDNENKIIDLSFVDDLQSWQNIIVEPKEYNPRDKNIYSMKSIYDYLLEKTPEKYKMLDVDSLDEETIEVIKTSSISYLFLKQGTLWQSWQKFCEALLLHIYKDKNGNTVCKYNGGN